MSSISLWEPGALSPDGPSDRDRWVDLLLVFGLVFFAWTVARTAWLADDAYITLRTVENFLHGYGLRWNIADRVQVYTHPAWMFLLSSLSFFTEEYYYTTLLSSILISAAAVGVFVFLVPLNRLTGVLCILILLLSKSFVEYSTSGLENPLTHLLLALFFWIYFSDRWSDGALFALVFIAAIGLLNRLDTALLFLPPLIYRARKWPFVRVVKIGLAGFSPLIVWFLFSLFYYGFLFPNPAYSKLGAGVSKNSLFVQGIHYHLNSFYYDPITLTILFSAILGVFFFRIREAVPLGIGVLLYLIYILRIGGDFMSGRFLSAPLFCATVALSRIPIRSMKSFALVGAAVLSIGLSNPLTPVRTGRFYVHEEISLDNQIADERGVYYQWTSLINHKRNEPVFQHGWALEGFDLRGKGQTVIPDRHGVGFLGFFAGPEPHIVDFHGLTDPFIARLKCQTKTDWRIGHFVRDIPEGYYSTLETGENRIEDPNLSLYYDVIQNITSGPLLSGKRLREIVLLNLGWYDDLLSE